MATAFSQLAAALAASNASGQSLDDVDHIVDKLEAAASPALTAQIDRIRKIVANAVTFEDVSRGLLHLASEAPSADFAEALRQAHVLANLAGASGGRR